MSKDEDDSLDDIDLSALDYDQVAGHFSDKALELEDEFPELMEPLLYAAKAVMALGRLNKKKTFGPHLLEQWRRNCTWMVYCKGRLTEKVTELDSDLQDMRADRYDDICKAIVRKNMRVSDEKVKTELRKDKEFRTLDRQVSDLRAILSHVLDHCDQYKLIKDVLVQESTLTKHMMAS